MSHWECENCGHEVYTMDDERPSPIRWTDGHICHFAPAIDMGDPSDVNLVVNQDKKERVVSKYRVSNNNGNKTRISPLKRIFKGNKRSLPCQKQSHI